jgi:hypothetical protein
LAQRRREAVIGNLLPSSTEDELDEEEEGVVKRNKDVNIGDLLNISYDEEE